MKNKFESVTFTNKGYTNFTHNLLESINKNEVDINLNINTLDKESYNFFKDKNTKVTFLKSESKHSEFLDQKSEEFGTLMIKKFECIYKSLLENELVLYIDGDIVIKRNFKDILIKKMENLDFLFQNDKNPKKPLQLNLCAGFMMIKSNKKTLKFFNPETLPINRIINYRTHDQTYIIKNRAKFKYQTLPLDKFPNGPYFYENYKSFEPWMVHFNYVLGKEKENLMKKYNEWYLDE